MVQVSEFFLLLAALVTHPDLPQTFQELGSDNFKVRESASYQLRTLTPLEQRAALLPVCRQLAASHKDMEVRHRCHDLIADLEMASLVVTHERAVRSGRTYIIQHGGGYWEVGPRRINPLGGSPSWSWLHTHEEHGQDAAWFLGDVLWETWPKTRSVP